VTTNPLTVSTADARSATADALIIGVTEGPSGPVPAHGSEETDAALGGTLAATLAALGATGKQDELTKIASSGSITAPLIVAVGLGPADQGEWGRLESLRRAAASAVRALSGTASSIALSLPARDETETEAVTLGALLGRHSFTKYRTSANGANGAGQPDLTVLSSVGAAAGRATELADAMTLVRDLVNTSPADLYPETFAAEAQRVAVAAGLEIEVLDHVALAGGGYGGITAVGQGSLHPPRLARLAYRSPGAIKTVVFVGKGITFDSGGLSLKPAKAMETMKSDMAGAAAVLGALQVIAAMRPAVNVIGYLAMAENMPGGTAVRPSDVITIFGGKTVEVLNTDAEGRLVLADALARSAEDAPDVVIDVATLTGAQLVALGPRISGVMSGDDDFAAAIATIARDAGEQAWPMPLPPDLRKGLDSAVADIANIAGERHGGMLVGGLFLKEFVPDGVRWAHVDIAGPAYNEGEPYGYIAKGGTGAAVRMLVQIATDVADGRL